MADAAGVILVGGRSSRMGRPKATLDWHGTPLVEVVASSLCRAIAGPIVVVRGPSQQLVGLPAGIEVAVDAVEHGGPLEGLAAGLGALEGRARAAFVSATDVPFLSPRFVRHVLAALEPPAQAAVPLAGGRMYPLSAAYRLDVLPVVRRLLAADHRRAVDLLDEVGVRWLEEDDLRSVDPDLLSLVNLNTPEEYTGAVARELPG